MATDPAVEQDEGTSSAAGSKDKVVPLAALEDERGTRRRLETEVAELRGKVDGLAAARPEPRKEERDLTRAELATAVTQGKISQDDADQIWDRQRDARSERNVRESVLRELNDGMSAARIADEIGRYQEHLPDLADRESEAFKQVAEEFRYQRSLGQPDNKATELTALRTVFGPAARLKKPSRGERESFEDGGGSGEAPATRRTDGLPKGMTQRERDYYDSRVGPGKLYPDWKAVEAEMQHANPALRKRMGARA